MFLKTTINTGIRTFFQAVRCNFSSVVPGATPTASANVGAKKSTGEEIPKKKLRGKDRPPKPDTFVQDMAKYSPRIAGDENFTEIYQAPHYAPTRLRLDWWVEKENFHHWTKWSMRKNHRHRQILKEYAPYRLRLKILKYARVLPLAIQKDAAEKLHMLPKQATFMNIRNRCQITSRHRGNVMRYRLSRIVFRDFADHGKLCGVKRGIW